MPTNRFKSNYLESGLGFELQYESTSTSKWSYSGGDCGGTFATQSGLIASPSYPDTYPENSDCVYHISQPEGTNVTMKILQVAMEQEPGSQSCHHRDYLEIRDGSDADAPILTVVCGFDPDIYPAIHSTQNHVWIR